MYIQGTELKCGVEFSYNVKISEMRLEARSGKGTGNGHILV